MNKQKWITNVCMGLFFFLSGVEYAVVIPTLNGFLIKLSASQTFLGIVMSAYSFGGLISAPIFGRISDRTRSTKACVIVGNLITIVGNIMYFMSTNMYWVLFGRLICGVGSGVSSSIFGMISRTTSDDERTNAFSLFMSLRQIGLIVGPVFNLGLHSLDFNMGRFHIDEYTAPGLLMTGLWLLHTIILAVVYKDTEKKFVSRTITDDYEEIGDDTVTRPRVMSSSSTSLFEEPKVRSFAQEFLREEVIVCITISFLVMFSQTGLETAVTPLTLLYFDWGSLKNSYLFAGASFVAVVSFISLRPANKRFSDRALVVVGCIGMIITYAIFLAYAILLYAEKYQTIPPWVLPVFLFDVALLTLCLPYLWVTHASLFSKITSPETQSFNQGVRMVSVRVGQILGPLWASPMTTTERLPIMVGVDFLLMLMIFSMVVLSYKQLGPCESRRGASIHYPSINERYDQVSSCEDANESTRLVRNQQEL